MGLYQVHSRGAVRRELAGVTSGSYVKYSHDYTFTWKVRRIFPMGWRAARCCGHYYSDSQCRPYFRVVTGRHPIDGGAPSRWLREGHLYAWQAQGGTANHDRTKDTGPWGRPR
jgi:hypothetical protein